MPTPSVAARRAPSAEGWTPSRLTLPYLWLVPPERGVSHTGAISQLSDISGLGGHFVQATGGKQATLRTDVVSGRVAARFAGGQGYRLAALDLSAALRLTTVIVVRGTGVADEILFEQTADCTANDGWGVFRMGAAGGGLVQTISNGTVGFNAAYTTPVIGTTPVIVRSIFDRVRGGGAGGAAEARTWINGIGAGGPEPTLRYNNPGEFLGNLAVNIGARNDATSLGLTGDILEALIIVGIPSSYDLYQLERFLARRNKITAYRLDSNFIFAGPSLLNGYGVSVYDGTPWNVATSTLTSKVHTYDLTVPSSLYADHLADILTAKAKFIPGLRNVAVMWAANSDFAVNGTAAAISAAYALAAAYREIGYKVVLCSETPSTGVGWNAARATINASYYANPGNYDVLADLAANTSIGDDGDELNTTYYTDGVHMTAAGYAIAGGIIKTAINSLGIV